MSGTTEEQGTTGRPVPRLLVGVGIFVLLLAGAGYAWTFTPSYSLYRIKQALAAHDYETFSQYVDLDSVLDHALDELAESEGEKTEIPGLRGSLGKLLRKGLFKTLARDARDITKASLEILVEQAVKDHTRPLPEIPTAAVIGALWLGQAENDTVVFPVKMKKKKKIEIRTRQTPQGLWRVIEVSNLSALLPALQRRLSVDQPDHE
jgi:hypothetical protein